ncbi:alpha/beta fold hydrolase [Nocardioides euryhalodurans]|uniref:Alpha/beta fold hydrolase n=2 Tax=Nocardioides euryhalodurans TaxID=2518370 RepID=A0A4P7GQ13_9ACTN|nr:alpha/beta fold hydrolase [Nocardioides euryhalodurans]
MAPGEGSVELYSFEDCVLDPRRFELTRGGEVVHVERQVFDVLVHLLSHRDRVVPKAELLDAVWGDRFVSNSALTSRLKAARRAIGDDGHAQRLIATVHGVGYRFVGDVVDLADGAAGVQAGSARQQQEIRYCTSPDGVRIAYAVSGSGPPLVKAANWLTHLDLEWESPIWAHWIDGLSDSHRLVRYDERGCGLSDWEVDDIGIEAWVEDLELVVDSVGVERFPLMGVSQGGAVAIDYAVRHPERVSHLVLVGAYCRGRLARAETAEEREEAALDLSLGRVAWRRDDASYRQVFASQFLPDADRSHWDAFNDLQRATTSTENVVRFLDTFAHIDVSEVAPLVQCPTLVVHSRRDHRVPASQAQELAALVPDSRLVLLDSANHVLTADEPSWPVLLAEVERFVGSGPG